MSAGENLETVIAAVSVVAAMGGSGLAVVIDNEDLPDETLAELLRATADKLDGKDDRSAGMW